MEGNLCPFFQKGSCKFGNNCRNSHQIQNGGDFPRSNNQRIPINVNNPNPNKNISKQKGVCTFFLQNKCNAGANCKYIVILSLGSLMVIMKILPM
jgi:hypothetical protein